MCNNFYTYLTFPDYFKRLFGKSCKYPKIIRYLKLLFTFNKFAKSYQCTINNSDETPSLFYGCNRPISIFCCDWPSFFQLLAALVLHPPSAYIADLASRRDRWPPTPSLVLWTTGIRQKPCHTIDLPLMARHPPKSPPPQPYDTPANSCFKSGQTSRTLAHI